MSGTQSTDAPRVFDWLHNKNRTIGMPHLTDERMASRVRMLMRSDLDHESVCTSARDRIMCLVKEKAHLAERVKTLEAERAELLNALKRLVQHHDDMCVSAVSPQCPTAEECRSLITKLEGTQEA